MIGFTFVYNIISTYIIILNKTIEVIFIIQFLIFNLTKLYKHFIYFYCLIRENK